MISSPMTEVSHQLALSKENCSNSISNKEAIVCNCFQIRVISQPHKTAIICKISTIQASLETQMRMESVSEKRLPKRFQPVTIRSEQSSPGQPTFWPGEVIESSMMCQSFTMSQIKSWFAHPSTVSWLLKFGPMIQNMTNRSRKCHLPPNLESWSHLNLNHSRVEVRFSIKSQTIWTKSTQRTTVFTTFIKIDSSTTRQTFSIK